MMKNIGLVFGAVLLSITSIIAINLPNLLSAESSGTPIDIWWPTDGGRVSGTQPFKALLSGAAVETYEMYWAVDGGGLVPMPSNYTDYPHKETDVDVSGWNWRGSGPYKINFVAKQNGTEVGQRTISIYRDGVEAAQAEAVIEDSVVTFAAVNSVATLAPVPTNTNSVVSSGSITGGASPTVEVWWPTPGATISGTQPFKAMLQNAAVEDYRIYWSVDDRERQEMPTNYTDYPHKETDVDVSGWNWRGDGQYVITFTATDLSGTALSTMRLGVTVNSSVAPEQSSAPVEAALAPSSAATTPVPGMNLYVNPNSPAARQAAEWRSSRPGDASMMDVLAAQSTASWFGDWNSDIYTDVHALVSAARSAGATPVIVLYNIPGRDCGSYSAGGSASNKYASWIGSVASAIGNASAIVILEPDALSQITCLSQKDQQERLRLLSAAVQTLKRNGGTRVYLDAGHSGWIDAGTMASRLKTAGIDAADGFALNVSNFMPAADEISYGSQVSSKVGDKRFVIDTGRNGLGSNGEWCNPAGRAIGTKPTSSTGNGLVDAYLWIKTPGESDGTCNGGPNAGEWWPDYALSLVRNAQ